MNEVIAFTAGAILVAVIYSIVVWILLRMIKDLRDDIRSKDSQIISMINSEKFNVPVDPTVTGYSDGEMKEHLVAAIEEVDRRYHAETH